MKGLISFKVLQLKEKRRQKKSMLREQKKSDLKKQKTRKELQLKYKEKELKF